MKRTSVPILVPKSASNGRDFKHQGNCLVICRHQVWPPSVSGQGDRRTIGLQGVSMAWVLKLGCRLDLRIWTVSDAWNFGTWFSSGHAACA